MTLPPIALNPESRRAALTSMAATELDVLVIGGGVVGGGAALDAATRGLRVGLVEAIDYGAGTSSRSSKLFHGGLRYLKQLNFSLVFEALRERKLMLTTVAPHLVRPVEFIFPLVTPAYDRAYAGAGIGFYDILGAGRGVPHHLRHIGKKKTFSIFPGAKRGTIRGGVLFYEGQVDDARHTMMLARTAASYGALCASSARVTSYLREGDRVVGARIEDLESGEQIDVRAKHVVNAAGVWTDELQEMVGGASGLRVKASKGVHIVVPRDRIDSEVGLITETEKSLLFVIPCPWSEDFWIIGTTDTEWNLDLAHPAASSADLDYILAEVNVMLQTPLVRDDIVGVYAGLRPLLAGESDETSKLSREHAVVPAAPGLTVIAGGKYTTYRVMAADAIDAAVQGQRGVEPSRTASIALAGADGYEELWAARVRLADEHGLPVTTVEHLLHRYGSMISEIFAIIDAEPELAAPLAESDNRYLGAEIRYAATHEGALHLVDILARRTHMSIETLDRGTSAAVAVADIVAGPLGWNAAQRDREIANYRARVAAEIESQRQPDDATADAARMGAPGVRGSALVADVSA
ncbi:glycerol-3-phosphate dehydrogenase/oxidase [Williamsia sp. CHRR-6]|uniref:glycerol-3-phosphate dehydrogenase/oxidase n=1 Tax=Williamsia sp. CHRR-6 TaxID=2835871 RepID=UPI001BDB42D7|nr:glycerol-3-phosphate dehydrogenase/oxidase [Williamsia sp. CHRR-6]MBT0566534.1 glycerol-3-phosphate dehydrogenase/oxidase [Williamsia sp. CHRR-6]